MRPLRRKSSTRALLEQINRKADHLMTTVDEVQASLTALTGDLEGLAGTAKAEFAKLETEVAEKAPEVNLTPLKESIDAIDSKVKSAASEVPST